MDQIDLEAEIEAADAEMLQAFPAEKDGMASYTEKQEQKPTNFRSQQSHKEVAETKTAHASLSRVN